MKINTNKHHIQTCVEPEIAERITKLAYKKHKTLSAFVRGILVDHFREIDYQKALKELQLKRNGDSKQ